MLKTEAYFNDYDIYDQLEFELCCFFWFKIALEIKELIGHGLVNLKYHLLISAAGT